MTVKKTMQSNLISLTLYLLLLSVSITALSPQWHTSPYFHAGSHQIINSLSVENQTQSYTFTYSSAFNETPRIAFGIQAYEGEDFLAQESFEVRDVGLDESTLQVEVEMVMATFVYQMAISYIAIDRDYPYFLDTFPNMPVNYSAGPIENISTYDFSNLTQTLYYSNTIDYTSQCLERQPTLSVAPTFPNSSSTRVALFLTSLYFYGRNERDDDPLAHILPAVRPIDLYISAVVVNEGEYRFDVSLKMAVFLDLLHLSVVFFDSGEIEGDQNLEMQWIQMGEQGGFVEIPVEFVDNMIIGWLDFSTPRTKTLFDFQWEVTTIDGVHGLYMPVSQPAHLNESVPSRVSFTLLYFKSWSCPNQTSFNPISNLCQCEDGGFWNETTLACQACSIEGCLLCLNADICIQCQDGTYFDINAKKCQSCYVEEDNTGGDTGGDGGDGGNGGGGDSSSSDDGVGVVVGDDDSDQGCGGSDSSDSSDDSGGGDCDANGQIDQYATPYIPPQSITCRQCYYGYYYDPLHNLCLFCQPHDHSLIAECRECHPTQFYGEHNRQCSSCPIQFCTTCQDNTTCSLCIDGYFFNSSGSVCDSCQLTGCRYCEVANSTENGTNVSSTVCVECLESRNYHMDEDSGQCQKCALSNCFMCYNLLSCKTCRPGYGYDISSYPNRTSINSSHEIYGDNETIVRQCVPCNIACSCDGYYLPWTGTACTTIIGDGFVSGDEQCDDGNLEQGDGCSMFSVVQAGYRCGGNPSICMVFIPDGSISILNMTRSGCNKFSMSVEISSALLSSKSLHFTVTPVELSLKLLETYEIPLSQTASQFTLLFQYHTDIHGENLTLNVNTNSATAGSISFAYQPAMPAVYMSEKECEEVEDVGKWVVGVLVAAYLVMALSAVAGAKIVGLEICGVLQVAYFSLTNNSFIHAFFAPFSAFLYSSGYNVPIPSPQSLPQTLPQLNIPSPTYVHNLNLTLVLLIIAFLSSIIFPLIISLLPKDSRKTLLTVVKQILLTLIGFLAMPIGFFIGLHWAYADGDVLSALAVGMTVVVIIWGIVVFGGKAGHLGQYRQKYKPGLVCQIYIVIKIFYRLLIGLLLSIFIAQPYSYGPFLLTVLCSLNLMYNLTNLPFIHFYQNYRANLIHITEMVILYISNYYRNIKHDTPMDIKGKIASPVLLEISLITLCLLVSVIVLIYELYRWVRDLVKSKDKEKEEIGSMNELNEDVTEFSNNFHSKTTISNNDAFNRNMKKKNKKGVKVAPDYNFTIEDLEPKNHRKSTSSNMMDTIDFQD